ncbi:MAG: hypothetical protein BroJett015_01070 [Chloroflexota bacterium]|nr:MAG: hypothetical protein BroJett015_01070 [Chloroflexota bacterium]
MGRAESAVAGLGGVAFINLMSLLYLPLDFLIPSSSSLATVTMPIMSPLADIASVNRSLIVTAYQSASGLLNIVNPTFAVVMGGLTLWAGCGMTDGCVLRCRCWLSCF